MLKNKVNLEQKLADDGHNLVKEFFVDERISMAATDLGMRMSKVGESRRTKRMSLDTMNNVNKEETLDDRVLVKERTVFEQSSMATADLPMRMSRAGESRRRIRRMHLDKASYCLSLDDASSENCLDVCPTIQKLSSVSQHLLLGDPRAVVDAHLRANSFCGSQAYNNAQRWKQSTWGGENDAGAQGPHCPPHYLMLHMQFSRHLVPEDAPPILQKEEIFPGNTKDLSPLKLKELLPFKPDDSENRAKLGPADLQNSQERSEFRVIGGSFSRIDTRSMKSYSNEVRKAPSSLPTSPLGSSRESHTAWIFRKILRRGSRVSSEISTHGTRSWEPQRERTSEHIISSESVVCEKCYVPRRPGATTQLLRASRESSTDETGNSWWPFKWKAQSKELRHNKSFKTTLVSEDSKVNIKAVEQVVHHRDTSSATYDDYSLASRSKPARFTSGSTNSQTIAWVLGTSPFAPEQRCIPTLNTEKFLLPPRRLNEPCA